jgi:hypothetical protein
MGYRPLDTADDDTVCLIYTVAGLHQQAGLYAVRAQDAVAVS